MLKCLEKDEMSLEAVKAIELSPGIMIPLP